MTHSKLTPILVFMLAMATANLAQANCSPLLDHDMRKLRSSESVDLCEAYAGKVLLLVNTASRCGFTPQFKGLEALHQKYRERGLVVAGFPSNSFRQEEADEKDIAKVCYVNYGVTFDMFADIAVTGADAHPLFVQLTQAAGAPQWNFNKYLVGADGTVIRRWSSRTTPDDPDLIAAIETALGANATRANAVAAQR